MNMQSSNGRCHSPSNRFRELLKPLMDTALGYTGWESKYKPYMRGYKIFSHTFCLHNNPAKETRFCNEGNTNSERKCYLIKVT